MGVPKFFRYISERYPCLSQLVKEFQIPDFDNLYLDMNGIIHACSHSNDFDPHFSITEEKIFASIFHYIEILFNLIKPRKLFFMAVDGVAPRAKMNQQRARRFRAAKEAEMKDKKAMETDGKPLPKDRFDSNCITPGTVFMDRLHSQLKYFVTSKVSTDPLWQGCKIILSGHQTPGEGEHKIMDYIRYLKTLPDYDKNTRHCLYGLDADLIMLGLCTHEPYFTLLREKVQFSSQRNKRMTSPDETEFYLLHLSLLREYLDLEFQELKDALPFEYNLENIIDDWVLMGFLVGNDFIPNLPDLHINKEAFPILYKAYKEVLPSLDGYLNENGYLSLARFEKYLEEMAKFDLEIFEDTYANLAFLEEKTGRSFSSEKKPNLSPTKKSDLEELIKATEEFEMSDDDFVEDHNDEENDNDTFLWEFSQHKKHYYTNKLDYRHVTSEVMKSQAEGYIRAIQWNLHYYYQGCQSWSWYYPHHYSPYISDVRGFKDLKLDFEMGRPFLPFEQLLAVLPAASKNLLPEAYHDLMISPDSPIIDFYPNDFQTDLNGKEQDWEAVVLIPFIDEKRLLEAMKKHNEKLTREERVRNQHGPMHVFTYTQENLGVYKSVAYFPDVPANHALMEDVTREAIAVGRDQLRYGLRPGVLPLALHPEFPTLTHIPFTASLKLSKVKVFDSPSRRHSMTLTLKKREFPPLDVLAQDILGKIIYSNWPFLIESRVVAVSDGKMRYFLSEVESARNEELNKTMQACWMEEAQNKMTYYAKNLGVEIGEVEVIVYVSTLEGRKYSFGPGGKVSDEKIWSALPLPWPLQVVVRDIPVHCSRTGGYAHFKDAFPENAVVFMLGQPHFGSMGRVLDGSDCCKNGRVKVALKYIVECTVPESFGKSQLKTVYLPWRVAAQKVGVSPRLFSRITGAILVSMTLAEGSSNPGSKINIGLNMKFSKKNEELPGYTKREGDNWTYSMAAVETVSRYVEKFSRVIEYLSNNQNTNIYFVQDIFPSSEGAAEMKEMINWVKEQEYQKVERLKCGSDVLDPEVISELEKAVEKNVRHALLSEMQVKPHLLYKSDLVMGNVPPVKSAKHKLLDRVVSVRSSYTVPTGLRGYIVGIHPSTSDADYVYDILFDRPFLGGMKLNTSSERVYKMSRASFLNLTDADRQSAKSIPNPPEPLCKANASLRASHGEPKTSAFAQWTHRPAPPQNPTLNDNFREIWSDLQRIKPQEDALKKILKIEENEKEKSEIEEPVKWFFEKITKVPSDSVSDATSPRSLSDAPGARRNKYYLQLLAFYKKLELGQPRFKFLHVGGKVMAQVVFGDGRVFCGLPCAEKDSACESASLQVLGAFGQIPLNNEFLPRKDRDKIRPQSRPPITSGSAPHNTPRRPDANVPSALPDPPSQWVLPNAPAPAPTLTRPNTTHAFLHNHRNEVPTKAQAVANSTYRKINASALEFVPLQAMTGKRYSSRPAAAHARAHPHPPAHAHAHAHRPAAEPQKKTEVVATFFGNAVTPPSTSKPFRRRQKIAAKLDFDPNLY